MWIKLVFRYYENIEYELFIICIIIFLECYEFSMFWKFLKVFDFNVFRNCGDFLFCLVGIRYFFWFVCRDN